MSSKKPPRHRDLARAVLMALATFSISSCEAPAQKASAAYLKGDYSTAFAIYSKLAQDGNPDAQFTLGLMYFEGTGVEKDHAEAARWYRRAANQGQVMAQNNLGAVLMNGQGVTQNFSEATFWFSLVSRSDSHGNQLRDAIAIHLTAEEQYAVRRKAENWKPTLESRRWFY